MSEQLRDVCDERRGIYLRPGLVRLLNNDVAGAVIAQHVIYRCLDDSDDLQWVRLTWDDIAVATGITPRRIRDRLDALVKLGVLMRRQGVEDAWDRGYWYQPNMAYPDPPETSNGAGTKRRTSSVAKRRPSSVDTRRNPSVVHSLLDLENIAATDDVGRGVVAGKGKGATRTRPRDVVFDTIAVECGIDKVTPPMGSSIAKVKKGLVAACREDHPDMSDDDIAAEVRQRAAVFRRTKRFDITPMALLKWWGTLNGHAVMGQVDR